MGPHNEGVQVTNDGATILKSIGVDNPAAKVLVGKKLSRMETLKWLEQSCANWIQLRIAIIYWVLLCM